MRFADVLPHLEAGRVAMSAGSAYRLDDGVLTVVVRQHGGGWRYFAPAQSANLKRTDWEVVEEPAPAKPDHCERHDGGSDVPCTCSAEKLRAGISEVSQRNEGLCLKLIDANREVARLTRERDEAQFVAREQEANYLDVCKRLVQLREAITRLPL